MTKRTHKKSKSKLYSTVYLGLAVFLVVFGTSFIVSQGHISRIASEEKRSSLQLGTFPKKSSTAIAPTPATTACNHDNGLGITPGCTCSGWWLYECSNRKCVAQKPYPNSPYNPAGPNMQVSDPNMPCDLTGQGGPSQDFFDESCASISSSNTVALCVGKPVIYLYPKKDTWVDVQVKTEGKVVISDPQIENGNTWKQVLAHPDGKLEYKENTYRELFYESETTTLNAPQKGIVISVSELETKLREYIMLLGLTQKDEQDEFLDWWVPRLKALHSPYIFFSVLEQQEKQRLDHVLISPKPDTFIEFIAYFRPMEKLESIKQLTLTPAPKREGFTAVEWGGIIDR